MTDLRAQLAEKVVAEVNNGHSYEALQLMQSFIARKKKLLGRKETSAMVFYGAGLLVDNGAPADAGTLLEWFIEDGAGDDFNFHMEETRPLTDADAYCDMQRIADLLNGMPAAKSSPIVTKIYGPVHKAVLSAKIKKTSPLMKRLDVLEQTFSNVFEETKDWLSAYKSVQRLQTSDVPRAAAILDKWSADGFPTEKPLFFGRAILQFLSEGKLPKATEMMQESTKYIEGLAVNAADVGAAMAVYNLSTILTQLCNLPERPRVNPPHIFQLIANLYLPLLQKVDAKLIDLLEKIGVTLFGMRKTEEAPNPMAAMMQSMLAGAGGGAGGAAGNAASAQAPSPRNRPQAPEYDMTSIMKMLAQQQRSGTK
jgi:hypothetical protein